MYRPINILTLFAITATISLISSCSILSPIKTPETKQYQIISSNLHIADTRADRQKINKKEKTFFNLTLFLTPLTADEPYNSTQMYYRENGYELSSYTQSLWAANPEQMLNKSLLQDLGSYHSFKNIVSSNFIGYADYRLTGNLDQLIQIINNNSGNTVLSTSFTLTNTSNGQVIATKSFTLNKSSTANAESFAQTTNELVAELAQTLNRWLIAQPLISNESKK